MTSEMENKEWLDDYLSLKQVNPTNPFTVPAGYFDELDERILLSIKLDEVKNTLPSDGFTVPENYFQELSNNIQSRITVETVLNTENTGFAVPENYFEEMSGQIKSRLFVEQVVANTDDAFAVPQDYFAQLNRSILNKTVNQDIVKRKSEVIRIMSSTVFKYATAACIILMIGAGTFLFRPAASTVVEHDSSYLHKELAAVPVDAIQNYLEQNVDANDTQHTVADEDLPINDADLKAALQDYENNKQ